jgi:hypothetical protein
VTKATILQKSKKSAETGKKTIRKVEAVGTGEIGLLRRSHPRLWWKA